MTHTLPMADPADTIIDSTQPLAGSVVIYDPAMCCPTGLCGPAVDPSLLVIARDLRWLEKHGVRVERFGLSQQPDVFVKQPKITGLMQAFGDKALPATLVNGEVLTYGRYPSREEVAAALGADADRKDESSDERDGGCGCAPGTSCC